MDVYIENLSIGESLCDGNNIKYIHDVKSVWDECTHGEKKKPDIILANCDSLSHYNDNICVLNFANNNIFGGGYKMLGTTQEEILAKRTTLGTSISAEHYPLDIVVDKLTTWDYKLLGLIYSPDVYILRDQYYLLNCVNSDLKKISVITCAAINNPCTSSEKYMFAHDREITRTKIKMILDIVILKGHKTLVAGQWGRGVFGNPLEICKLWVDEIARRNIKVIFPIFSESFADAMSTAIKKYD